MTLLTVPAAAQSQGASVSGGTGTFELAERAQRIQLMERALETAVSRGMEQVEGQLPGVPGLVFFAGSVQVRGFELQDYGVFFDVEYPVVRRSILWSMGTLQGSGGISRLLDDLRRRLHAMPDGPGQAALEQALAEMEASLRAFPAGAAGGGDSQGGAGPMTLDISQTYRDTLTTELVGAMVSHGGALGLAGDRWLSVAARDGRGRVDPSMTGQHVMRLRISGRDLAALREGTLSLGDARQRVERSHGGQ